MTSKKIYYGTFETIPFLINELKSSDLKIFTLNQLKSKFDQDWITINKPNK